jgi:hypothetical protein
MEQTLSHHVLFAWWLPNERWFQGKLVETLKPINADAPPTQQTSLRGHKMAHAFWTGFGIVLAVLAVGGYIFLRWQQDRQRFELAKAALERGMTTFPGLPPLWLDSVRAGMMILTLGIGLLAAGELAYGLAEQAPLPDSTELQATSSDPQETPREKGERGVPPPRRSPPNPAVVRWERSQNQRALGLVSMCGGVVLVLLGLVRVGFAWSERRLMASQQPRNSAAKDH